MFNKEISKKLKMRLIVTFRKIFEAKMISKNDQRIRLGRKSTERVFGIRRFYVTLSIKQALLFSVIIY